MTSKAPSAPLAVTPAVMTTIYQCMYRESHTPTQSCNTFNQGKRDRCKGCKSAVRPIRGHAIIAHWRGDSRYSLDDAIKVFSSMLAAEKAAMRLYEQDNRSDVVARFLPSV